MGWRNYFFATCLVLVAPVTLGKQFCNSIADASDRITIELVESRKTGPSSFDGTFVIKNNRSMPIVLGVVEVDGVFHIADTDLRYQFRDINRRWLTFVAPVGSVSGYKKIRVKPGHEVLVTAPLPTSELMLASDGEVRVLVRLFTPRICAVSSPIAALPVRPVIEGFRISK